MDQEGSDEEGRKEGREKEGSRRLRGARLAICGMTADVRHLLPRRVSAANVAPHMHTVALIRRDGLMAPTMNDRLKRTSRNTSDIRRSMSAPIFKALVGFSRSSMRVGMSRSSPLVSYSDDSTSSRRES